MNLTLKTIEQAEKSDIVDIIDIYKNKYTLPLNKKDNKILSINLSINDDTNTINTICDLILDTKIAIVCIYFDNLYTGFNSFSLTPYGFVEPDTLVMSKEGRAMLAKIRDNLIGKGLYTELYSEEFGTLIFGQLNTGLIF